MLNLISINYNNQVEVLFIISILAIICGILVVTNNNPIISILFLIGLFLNITGYLFLIGLNFIGYSYLITYVGAVSILFLFVLMLINIRISELTNYNKNSLPLALFIGILCYSSLYNSLYYNTSNNIYLNNVNFVTSNIWDGSLTETLDVASIGNILYTNYYIWLILTSIILLIAMVGAIVITTKKI